MSEKNPFTVDTRCLSRSSSELSSWSSTVTHASFSPNDHKLSNPDYSTEPIHPEFPQQGGRVRRFLKKACSFGGVRRRRVRFQKQLKKSSTSEVSSLDVSPEKGEHGHEENQPEPTINPFETGCELPEIPPKPKSNPLKKLCTKWSDYRNKRERKKCEKSISKQEKRIEELEKTRARIKQMDAEEGKIFAQLKNKNGRSSK
jgi:hypothetical protein